MIATTGLKSILLISTSQTVIEATRAILEIQANLHLIDRTITPNNLFNTLVESQPDVILLDFQFQSNPFVLVDKIVSRFPMSVVVAILSESEAVSLDRVVLSGARAFVYYPYHPGKLVIAIKRVMELLERKQIDSPQDISVVEDSNPVRTFTVFSPKGGAGTTTIAVNLAISLHKSLKEDVLLIDGKHLFGHVALYLNLVTGNSLTDLIAHAGTLDAQLINQVVVQHKSGIHVLPNPKGIAEAQGIKPEYLFKVLQNLHQVFPYIIIDGGNNLTENTVTYMDISDKILLVLNPDLASMRDVRLFKEISSTLSYPKEKTLYVLNLTERKADMKKGEIEEILKLKIFGMIPTDENLALSCINEGIPILLKKPRHPISKAISDITKDLVRMINASKTG